MVVRKKKRSSNSDSAPRQVQLDDLLHFSCIDRTTARPARCCVALYSECPNQIIDQCAYVYIANKKQEKFAVRLKYLLITFIKKVNGKLHFIFMYGRES
jgi:hypothetical protein